MSDELSEVSAAAAAGVTVVELEMLELADVEDEVLAGGLRKMVVGLANEAEEVVWALVICELRAEEARRSVDGAVEPEVDSVRPEAPLDDAGPAEPAIAVCVGEEGATVTNNVVSRVTVVIPSSSIGVGDE